MSLGTIFTTVLIIFMIGGALYGLFKNGIKVFFAILFWGGLALALLPYLGSALLAVLSTILGALGSIIVLIVIIWGLNKIFS